MNPLSHIFKTHIWITPAVYCLIAFLLAIGCFYMDIHLVERINDSIPPILLTSVEIGKDIMGILAAAILTMTTFIFSTVLVVLTTYTAQFSPRTPENFVHGKITRRVLGIFLGGFVFTAVSLLYMQDKTFEHEILTPTIGLLIAFFCVGTFAYYIHFVSSNVQVTVLVNKLAEDAERVIHNYRELQEENYVSLDKWKPSSQRTKIGAYAEGYIQFIDLILLVKLAEKQNIEIEVVVKTGDYVYQEDLVMYVYEQKEQKLDFSKFYKIGSERTVEQDLEYAIQKLLEVAIRAISPSLNDPNTANEILIRIGRLLGEMGKLKTHGWVMTDSQEANRVLYKFPAYSTILYKTFYQLSHYGKDDISVLLYMTESLIRAAKKAPSMRHEAIWETQKYILDGVDVVRMKKLDLQHLQEKVDDLAEIAGQKQFDLNSNKEAEA